MTMAYCLPLSLIRTYTHVFLLFDIVVCPKKSLSLCNITKVALPEDFYWIRRSGVQS